MNTPSTGQEDRVAPDGVSLHTRSVGDGPEVVILHGGPGAHHDYLLPQFDALADGRRLRYYDQRGGGRSPVERDVSVGWEAHVTDLYGLIDHWGCVPATLIGYSWGGLLALLFAIEHPTRVKRLALVSPAAATSAGRSAFDRRFAARMQQPDIAAARAALRASNLRATDPEAYRRQAFILSIAGYFKDFRLAAGLTPFRVTGKTQAAVWDSLGDYDLTDRLAPLRGVFPTLVMHGEHDPIPIDTARDTAELLGAEFVALDAGHVPYVEARSEWLSALDRFLPRSS